MSRLPPSPDLAHPEDPLHDEREPHVDGREEYGQHDHDRQDDDGRVGDLAPAGPVHPTELAEYFAEELLDALEECHVLSLVEPFHVDLPKLALPESGRRGGIRTPIPRIWSPVLSPLELHAWVMCPALLGFLV